MSNQQINQYLDEQTNPNDGDWYDIDAYNGGTPLSKKISWATIKNSIIQSSPNIYKADGILTGDRDVNLDSNFLRFRNGVTMFGGAGNSALSAVSLSKKNTGVNEYLRAWDDSNSSFWQIGSDQRFTYRTASGGFIALGDETNGGTQLNSKWLSLHGDVALRSGKTFNFGDSNQITNDSNFLGFGIDVLAIAGSNGNHAYIYDNNSLGVIALLRPNATSTTPLEESSFTLQCQRWNGTSSDNRIGSMVMEYVNDFRLSFNFTTDTLTYRDSLNIYDHLETNLNQTTLEVYFNDGVSVVNRRVVVGAADSAGTGYRTLRIAN